MPPEYDIAKMAATLKDLTFSAALLLVLIAAFTRKWVPGIYYREALAKIEKLEGLVVIAHDAADRATRVSESAMALLRERAE